MEAKELRIGNYINGTMQGGTSFSEKVTVDATVLSIINKEVDINSRGITFIPIPITEEWLQHLGFNLDDDNYYIEETSFGVEITEDEFIVFFGDNIPCYYTTLIPVKYVHQLQNLYFSLTQKELLITN